MYMKSNIVEVRWGSFGNLSGQKTQRFLHGHVGMSAQRHPHFLFLSLLLAFVFISFKRFTLIFKLCIYIYMHIYMGICTLECRGLRRARGIRSLEPELQAVVSCLIQVLGTGFVPSAKAAHSSTMSHLSSHPFFLFIDLSHSHSRVGCYTVAGLSQSKICKSA